MLIFEFIIQLDKNLFLKNYKIVGLLFGITKVIFDICVINQKHGTFTN